MSTSTTFSYAQAAKGQSATPASSTSQGSPTASQVAAATQTRDGTVAATNSESSTQAPTSSIEVAASGAKVASEQDMPASNPTAQTEPTASSESAKPVPPQGATDKSETETTQQSSDRQSRSSAPSSRSQESSDSRKPKKGKKSKTAEKDSEAEQEKKEEPQPKIELAEAPIPSVNIWQQRLGEQATKSKPSAPARSKESIQASQESTTVKSKATTTGEVDASVGNSRPAANGSRPHRKGGDASRSNDEGVTRRSAPRGSRVNEREEKSSLPAISNSASWPTPETAASSEVKAPASTSSEKDDKDDANANKTEKKKWIAVPFVPTAKFNTPIPGRGAPRTGGRGGSRATRDAPARGGSNSVSSGVNGRPQETGSSTQGPSDSAKAVSTEASVSQETRKPAGPASVDSAKITGEAPAPTTSGKPSQVVSENGTTERVSAPRSADGHKGIEGTKESASHHHRESHQGPNGTHRSSDRPRGGRGGRGGHNANGTTHQASYGHGSNGYSFHPNSRQGSQQAGSGYSQMPYSTNYSASSSGTNHRGRPNSVSLGRSQTNGGGRHNNPRLPHIQPPQAMPYDAQMYPQTAIPYDYFSANVLALVQAQVDYYFSVDNLCKDYFLRKNMDSQGYVLLAVIANFRRMKEMTTDYDMIRAACEESHEVELVYAEDGQDRVRRATGWQSWVIQDVGSREYAAQNDGPQNVYRHNRPFYPQYHPQMMHNGFMPGAPPMFSPNGTNMGFMPYMNGSHMGYPAANGNGVHAAGHTDSQLSATVPEFAPTGFQTPQDHTAPETGKKGAPLPRNAAHHGAEASHGEAAHTNGTIQGQ